MENEFELNDKELEKVLGGLGTTNPVSGLTKEEARKIDEKLGEGKDMGSWKTMSGDQFMKWWERSNTTAAASSSNVGGVCGYNDSGIAK